MFFSLIESPYIESLTSTRDEQSLKTSIITAVRIETNTLPFPIKCISRTMRFVEVVEPTITTGFGRGGFAFKVRTETTIVLYLCLCSRSHRRREDKSRGDETKLHDIIVWLFGMMREEMVSFYVSFCVRYCMVLQNKPTCKKQGGGK